MSAPGVEFVPIGSLGDGEGGTTTDYARTRARWQRLPDEWMSEREMREAIRVACGLPDWDGAGAMAAMVALEDWIEARGPARAREYRRVESPPEPMGPAGILAADAARAAEVERERFERELEGRERVNREREAPFFENQRRVHRELADEYTVPMIRALAAQVAALEQRLAQHGAPEAAGAASTPSPNAAPAALGRSEADIAELPNEEFAELQQLLAEGDEPGAVSESSDAPAEPATPGRLEQVRRWMFGDASEGDVERLLDDEEDDD